MTDEARQTTPRPILNATEAQLFVANLKIACDFYTDKLGFAVAFVSGDPPFYGQVVRDKARINLRLVCEPVFAGDVRKREGLLSASITVAAANETKQLFLSYQAAGVPFHQGLKKEPWGARTFVVSDPDGNLILFAGPATDEGVRNPITFPAAVPEIPSADVVKSAAYYVNALGFTFDWGDDQGGIAGISRGNCRLFLANRSFRESYGNTGRILFWLNLDSKSEVDELFVQWKTARATIVSQPEDKPWKLREFMAADLDGNLIRVFYDFPSDKE